MRKAALLFLALLVISCGSRKEVTTKKNSYPKSTVKSNELHNLYSEFSGKNSSKIEMLLKDAEKYIGVPYKYAGNTPSGFDCSGFVCKVFDENEKKLPRRSTDQAETGEKINIKSSKPGDLIFFATSGGDRVSHVGIIHDIGRDGEIKFIHASTSKGVTISSLNEKYWNKAFLFARRIF